MKKLALVLSVLAVGVYANCYSYSGNNWKTTNCYNNGVSQTWNSYKVGNMTTTNYSNNRGTTGITNEYNYRNGNYQRTYHNSNGYSSITTKTGSCYYFTDNNGNSNMKCH